MNERTLRVSGLCVNPERTFRGTITIDCATGLICGIGPYDPGADIALPAGSLIFPGLVDVHTHGRQDATGQEIYKEDFKTSGEAAVNGGVVHVAEMGNNPKPPIDDESYAEKSLLTASSCVPVTLYAMIGPQTMPLSHRVPYKMCHARTTGKNDIIFFPSWGEIEEAAKRYRGCHVSHHCEDSAILKLNEHEKLHELKRPPEAETSSVKKAIYLIENYFGKGKLCHCSVASGIKDIVEAKRRGVQVACEVTPHHLYFDTSMITDANRPWMQMNPPLRSPEDRLSLISALREGDIDMIATDHAPHTVSDKIKGASGQPHLDTLGPFVTWLMAEHGFKPEDIARICSFAPAQFLNQFLDPSYGNGYGRIEVGYVGSLTVIDTSKPVTIAKSMLKTKCGWSPFEGVTFPGSVRHTIVKGAVLK
ncbi:MAG: amidohydrolase family protein [Patescibacteria group bacterium]|nr:amidohydrolase family protein [Patescibacteria group bacterium]